MTSPHSSHSHPDDPGHLAHTPASRWRSLRVLVPYLSEFPGRVALSMSFLIGAKLAAVGLPLLMARLVNTLNHAPSNSAMTLMAVPVGLLLAYGGLRFFSVLAGELRDIAFGRVTLRAMRRSALSVFQHLHRLDLNFHLSRRTGELSRDIERGVEGIRFLLRFTLFNILPTLFEITLVSIVLWQKYAVGFALIALLSVVLYIVFSVVVTEWRTDYVRRQNQLDSRANGKAIDALINYETVKYFGNEEFESRRYDASLIQWESAADRNRMSLAFLNIGQALIVAGALTAMMWFAAIKVRDGALNVGDFVAVNAFMIQLFIPLNFLGFVYREVRRAVADMQRMFGLLDANPKVADAPDAEELPQIQRAEVRFENVRFGYGADRQVLHDVSFTIPAGKKMAIVGASGAGKSTLGRLLFRFYDVDGGSVRVAGKDVRSVSQASLRALIGVVPQDTVLFNDSIYYNIAYGRPDATREEVERAARMAHLDGFISSLPKGYDTEVGERGLKLSGGEKQRIAIARAIVKDPPILILDEATSSLDSNAEAAILDALKEAAAHRTTLAIAHRLSTVTDADEIVVLDGGRVVERGSHAQLLAQGGVYARLWRLQLEEPAATDLLRAG